MLTATAYILADNRNITLWLYVEVSLNPFKAILCLIIMLPKSQEVLLWCMFIRESDHFFKLDKIVTIGQLMGLNRFNQTGLIHYSLTYLSFKVTWLYEVGNVQKIHVFRLQLCAQVPTDLRCDSLC